jgi:ClpP class serine protease
MEASPFGAILSQLFWIVLILLAVMPMVRQRMLESARLSLIRQIEKKRGSRVIVLIHRQESLALFGVPLFRFISVEDSEEVLRAIRMTPPDMPIDIVLHTPGGLVLASQQIACALCDHKAKVTAFVPHYAMSGGTLIALAADEIVMDPHAVLGPIDPQVGQFPAASILKVLEQKDANEVDDQTLILADISRKALQQALTLGQGCADGERDGRIARARAGRSTHAGLLHARLPHLSGHATGDGRKGAHGYARRNLSVDGALPAACAAHFGSGLCACAVSS